MPPTIFDSIQGIFNFRLYCSVLEFSFLIVSIFQLRFSIHSLITKFSFKFLNWLTIAASKSLFTDSSVWFTLYFGSIDWASLVAQMVKNPPTMQEIQFQSLGWEEPLEKEWLATPVFLLGEFQGHWRLASYSLRHHKELDTS